MQHEFKIFGLKLLSLAIVAPLMGGGLLYISEKLESAWKQTSKKKKFWALTMLVAFLAICLGWLL